MSSAPLRIALIAPSRFPIVEPFVGGLEAHVWLLAKTLKARGHQVTLFSAPGSDSDIADKHHSFVRIGPDGLHRRDVSHDPQLVIDEHRAYLTVLDQLATGSHGVFDVIHNHSLHYLPVALAHRLCAPVVSTLHTPPIVLVQLAMRAVTSPRPTFVAVSEHTARSWVDAKDPVGVVRNGVDTSVWTVGSGGGPAIWFGRIVPEKGPDLALRAAARAGIPIDLVGPISDAEFFAAEVAPLLGPTARHLGHLHQEQLAEVVRNASVAVVTPRWDEPFGLVAAEAMACGTPVAAFRRGGLPEFISAECGRLAEPDDVDDLALAITEAAGLSRTGVREHALAHCSATAMVAQYEDIYRGLARAS